MMENSDKILSPQIRDYHPLSIKTSRLLAPDRFPASHSKFTHKAFKYFKINLFSLKVDES